MNLAQQLRNLASEIEKSTNGEDPIEALVDILCYLRDEFLDETFRNKVVPSEAKDRLCEIIARLKKNFPTIFQRISVGWYFHEWEYRQMERR